MRFGDSRSFFRTCLKSGRGIAALAAFVLLALASGCDGAGEMIQADCERLSTAQLKFKNSSSSATYKVLLDNAIIATLGPGQSSEETVAAGLHAVGFLFASNNARACSDSTPNLASCAVYEASCGANQQFRSVQITHSANFSAGIALKVGSVRYDIGGPGQTIRIPMTSEVAPACVWECPTGVSCRWDCNYQVREGGSYQVVSGSNGDLTLVLR